MLGNYRFMGRAMALATAVLLSHTVSAQSTYSVVKRGLNFDVLQKTTVENGTNHVHQYVRLEAGLNFTNQFGQLVPADETITLLPNGGAAGTNSQHQVFFPADIYNGVLQVVTPDGRSLESRPLGIAYDDGSNTVFIASLTNATGCLVGSNQVAYRGAFGSLGDLVCQYRRSGFQSDMVFRQQPPNPADLGLNADSTTLQMVTEFFDTADPQEIPAGSDDWYGLLDSTLKFGKLTMGRGKAFALPATNSATASARVYKRWLHVGTRKFLVEEIPLADVAADLNTLPQQASIEKPAGKAIKFASNEPQFPASHPVIGDTNRILLASADFKHEPGMVLDYNEIDSGQDDFTFQSGQTYLIGGDDFPMSGQTVFESGTVIKINALGWNNGTYPCVDVYDSAVFPSDPGNPAIFTSANDDSVGEVIDGSTGNPSFTDSEYSFMAEQDMTISNVCFNYVVYAVVTSGNMELWNCEFAHVDNAIEAGSNIGLHNILYCHGTTNWGDSETPSGDPAIYCNDLTAENVTLDDFPSGLFNSASACLTNCLLTASGDHIGDTWMSPLVTNQVVNLPAATNGIYQTAANANYYLAAGSPYRNVGTTNISPDLLAELRTMTTYAPQDGGFPDTNANVDLGYHYSVNEDSTATGVPDSWIWHWFGNYNENGTNTDGSGNTLLSDYLNSLDPNVISFTMESTNDYVNCTNVLVQLNVSGGIPSYYAIVVNGSATTNWLAFVGTNLTARIGPADGIYDVAVGLKGFATNATVTWHVYRFRLDRTAPVVAITNPQLSGALATVIKPYLQLQGFANEPLYRVSYDISNSLCILSNRDAFVTDQSFDTNAFDFTTNFFQCYDVPLATNDNLITVHVTDRAGNTAATNFDVVLDFSTATSPPVISVIWPPDGSQLSVSNCTIRGTMSDETGTIIAQVVNGDGTTNLINGIVERNGMYWLDNVPLNGTNQISIQATDAVGNITTTNITIYPSSIQLTVNSTPTGDALYQPFGSVSGTVSDPSATVTVNGANATVDPEMNDSGTYDWNSAQTPIFGTGTATFDAMANSSSAQPALGNSSVVMGPYYAVTKHNADKNLVVHAADYGTALRNEYIKQFAAQIAPDSNGQWRRTIKGTLDENYFYIANGDGSNTMKFTWSATNTGPNEVISGNGYRTFDQYNDDDQRISAPDEDVYSGPHSFVGHYFADGPTYSWGSPPEDKEETITAHSEGKLYTGGRGKIQRQNLFGLLVSVFGYAEPNEPFDYNVPWNDTPSAAVQGVTVMGQAVGSDNILWRVLPDNASPTVVIKATGPQHYGATLDPVKYKLAISAGGVQLDPATIVNGANFCVGQNIPFYLAGLPDGVTASDFTWYMDGDYVNGKIPAPNVNCSDIYTNDASLLSNPVITNCWWVSGDAPMPDIYTATVDCTLHFANGNPDESYYTLGGFFMFRPEVKWIGTKNGSVAVDSNYEYSKDGSVFLHFGFLNVLAFPANTGVSFKKEIIDDGGFSGTFTPWQLRDMSVVKCGTNGISQHISGSGFDSPPIWRNNFDGNTYWDNPGAACNDTYNHVSMQHDDLETTLMFQPSGGIAVPLKIIKWNWHGTADKNPVWTLTSGDGAVSVTDQDTTTFPVWTNVIDGTTMTGFTIITNGTCE